MSVQAQQLPWKSSSEEATTRAAADNARRTSEALARIRGKRSVETNDDNNGPASKQPTTLKSERSVEIDDKEEEEEPADTGDYFNMVRLVTSGCRRLLLTSLPAPFTDFLCAPGPQPRPAIHQMHATIECPACDSARVTIFLHLSPVCTGDA